MTDNNGEKLIAVIGIMLIVFALAFLIPAIFLGFESTQTASFTQETSDDDVINGYLVSSISAITDNPGQQVDSANVTLVNLETGSTGVTGQINEGDTVTVSLTNGDIDVTLVEVLSDTTAIILYEYPLYIGWPEQAQTVFNNLPGIIMAMALLLIIGLLFVLIEVFR